MTPAEDLERDAVARLVAAIDLTPASKFAVDARFAFAVQVGDHGQQTVNVGVGPLVPLPGSREAVLVDSATSGLRPPPVLEGLVARSRRNRWVVVTGPAGAGKSSTVCALARPDLCEGRVPQAPDPHFVHAVVSLDATSTPWWLAEQLAEQFRVSIPRYAAAVAACRDVDPDGWEALSLWQQRIGAPLALLARADAAPKTSDAELDSPDRGGSAGAVQVVRVVIDGWDQLAEEYATDLHQVVHTLAHDPQAPVHVIVSARTDAYEDDELLADAGRLELPPPVEEDVADYLRGRHLPDHDATEIARLCVTGASGWLLARLIGDGLAGLDSLQRAELIRRLALEPDRAELIRWMYQQTLDTVIAQLDAGDHPHDHAAASPAGFEWLRPVLAPLSVAGVGAVMPRIMLDEIAAREGPLTTQQVEHVLRVLDRLVIRAHPGTNRELVGLFHPTLVEYLNRRGPHWVDVVNTRQVVLDQIQRLAPVDGLFRDNPLARWAEEAEVDYLWAAGMPRAAFRAMLQRPLPTPAQNLERWTAALPRFLTAFGPQDHDTLRTRAHIASCTGKAGDPAEALRLFQELFPDHDAVWGPRHPDTFALRNEIACWTGEAGNYARALQLLQELLPDQEAVLGPHHPDTLTLRNNIASWTGEAGDPAEALRLLQKLLLEQEAVLGPQHADTLTTRGNIASWTAKAGDPAEALRLLQKLLLEQEAVLGPQHVETVTTRNNIAALTAQVGNFAQALQLFQELLPDQEAVLGPHHPDTLATRHNIAYWTGEARDAAGNDQAP